MGAGHGGCREPWTSNALWPPVGWLQLWSPLLTLHVTQTSALREIVETWEESSGGFCLRLNGVVAPRGTQAKAPRQGGVLGTQARGGVVPWMVSVTTSMYCFAPRAPSAFLENVDQRRSWRPRPLRATWPWP